MEQCIFQIAETILLWLYSFPSGLSLQSVQPGVGWQSRGFKDVVSVLQIASHKEVQCSSLGRLVSVTILDGTVRMLWERDLDDARDVLLDDVPRLSVGKLSGCWPHKDSHSRGRPVEVWVTVLPHGLEASARGHGQSVCRGATRLAPGADGRPPSGVISV